MSDVQAPDFTHQIIHHRKDGYWIDQFYYHKNDKAPGLIVSGLEGEIEYLENPGRGGSNTDANDPNWVHVQDEKETGWTAHKICKLPTPVPTASLDVTGNGFNDLIVGYNFGETMIESDADGGDIIWLENPGRDATAPWKQHFIGRWPTVHRLAVGYFTQRTFPEIVAAPVVHGPRDKETPVPLICFQKPDDRIVKDVVEWRKDVVDDGHFRVIHEIYKKSLDGPQGLDSLLIASMDGVSRLYYEGGHWKRELIGQGKLAMPGQRENHLFPAAGDLWGAGTADAGRMGSDPFAYVAVNEPFHGPYISLYAKKGRGQPGNPWKRHILDVYGTPTQKQCWGDGPVHNIVCADIDGDGQDEFLVSMFGPVDRDAEGNTPDKDVNGVSPNKGIWCYKVIDLDKGIVAKWHLSTGSSARCAVGAFSGEGTVDLASLSYHVKKYYREENPVVTLHRNQSILPAADPQIIGTLWDKEGMVYLPRPEYVKIRLVKELIDIAHYAIRVEVYPPGHRVTLNEDDGIKVIFGSLTESVDGKLVLRRRPLGGEPFPAKDTLKHHGNSVLKADERLGAIVLRLEEQKAPGQWRNAWDVPVTPRFDLSAQGMKFPKLAFVKVQDLWWGGDFKGYDFYNLTGFHFRLQDNKQNLCHMQFWTAGPNVHAEYHNHNDNAFKELHTCLSQGTPDDGTNKIGGMWASRPSTCDSTIPTPIPIESLSLAPSQSQSPFPPPPEDPLYCGLKPLEEHGRIWHEDATGHAVYRRNNTVSYPRHEWAAGDGGKRGWIDVWMALEFDAWLDFAL